MEQLFSLLVIFTTFGCFAVGGIGLLLSIFSLRFRKKWKWFAGALIIAILIVVYETYMITRWTPGPCNLPEYVETMGLDGKIQRTKAYCM